MKKRAGRPRKKPSDVKNVDLRIPVTPAQKQLVDSAAKRGGQGMAEWARAILLAAAAKQTD